PELVGRERQDTCVYVLCGSDREIRDGTRVDRVDQRPRRVVDPVDVLRLADVVGEPRRRVEPFGEINGPRAPEGDVPKDGRHGPVIVDRPAEVVVAETFGKVAEPLELAGVVLCEVVHQL